MRHKIIEKQNRHPYIYVEVELVPENKREQQAINNVRTMAPTQEDKDIVENYMLFRLNAVSSEWIGNNRVILKCSAV